MTLPLLVLIHVGRGFRRGLLAIVEEVDFAIGAAEEHEASAADVAGLGIDDLQREADGDGGIDGVAALLHDRDARPSEASGCTVATMRLGRMRRMHHVSGEHAGNGRDYGKAGRR